MPLPVSPISFSDASEVKLGDILVLQHDSFLQLQMICLHINS